MVFELSGDESAAHTNPYATVTMHAEFRSPKFRTFLMPAFWDGGNRMVLRFSPPDAGEWTFKVTSNIKRFDGVEGRFTAADNDSPGFIRPRNVHHWSYAERDFPHLWMGDTIYNFAVMDKSLFEQMVNARAEQHFTHIRGGALGTAADAAKAFPTASKPNPDFFRTLDQRLAYLNSKGIIADLILGSEGNQLANLLPTWTDRERFLRYLVARYSAFNITWHLVQDYESYADARAFTKQLGEALKRIDPYGHPRSTGAAGTSTPLLSDGWMTFATEGTSADDIGAIEHQLYPVPFVATRALIEDSGAGKAPTPSFDSDEARHRLWNSTMSGQYPTFANTGTFGGRTAQDAKYIDSPAARAMKVWFEFFKDTRYWELEPYFDLDGGRAIALPDVEYIVYVEKPAGPVEVRVEKHGYDVSWINPATGETSKPVEMKSERVVSEPPSRDHDWVLHIERSGRKEGMLRSYKFESRPNLMQDVDADAKRTPFTIAQPEGEELSVSKQHPFSVKVTRQTRGTRNMTYVWTAEVSAEGQGYRVVGTGADGSFIVPDIFRKSQGVLNIRLYGMNANGKVYLVDKLFRLVP